MPALPRGVKPDLARDLLGLWLADTHAEVVAAVGAGGFVVDEPAGAVGDAVEVAEAASGVGADEGGAVGGEDVPGDEVAADGEAGLNAALDTKPDLIILDIMLPKINGYEICRLAPYFRGDSNRKKALCQEPVWSERA